MGNSFGELVRQADDAGLLDMDDPRPANAAATYRDFGQKTFQGNCVGCNQGINWGTPHETLDEPTRMPDREWMCFHCQHCGRYTHYIVPLPAQTPAACNCIHPRDIRRALILMRARRREEAQAMNHDDLRNTLIVELHHQTGRHDLQGKTDDELLAIAIDG